MDAVGGDVSNEIRETLERFGRLVSARDMDAVAEFAPREDVLLVGSEQGEITRGRGALAAFLQEIFHRPETFTWEWTSVEVSSVGDVAWLYAEGHVLVRRDANENRAPYRLTGIFERVEGVWRWRQFHGSEPA